MADEDDVAIAAITVADLLVGVDLAHPRRRAKRQQYLDDILDVIPVEGYDLEVAQAHGALLAHARRSGTARGAHDLIIAATAVATGRVVVTADQSGFRDLPGLSVRSV